MKDLAGAPEEPLDHEAEVKDVVDIEEEKEEVEMASEEQVAELNMKAALERAQEDTPLQNLTIAEPMQSRTVEDIVEALSKVHAHYRMLGVRPCRLHSDREKSFLTRAVARWVQAREMVHTMTSGDDGQSNGRVEAELLQLKRRMRLLQGGSFAMAMCLEARGNTTTSATTSEAGGGLEAHGQLWADGHGQIQEMASPDGAVDNPLQEGPGAGTKPSDVGGLGG